MMQGERSVFWIHASNRRTRLMKVSEVGDGVCTDFGIHSSNRLTKERRKKNPDDTGIWWGGVENGSLDTL